MGSFIGELKFNTFYLFINVYWRYLHKGQPSLPNQLNKFINYAVDIEVGEGNVIQAH